MCVAMGPNLSVAISNSEKSYHVQEIVRHVATLLEVEVTPELTARVMVTLNGMCKDWRGERTSGVEGIQC